MGGDSVYHLRLLENWEHDDLCRRAGDMCMVCGMWVETTTSMTRGPLICEGVHQRDGGRRVGPDTRKGVFGVIIMPGARAAAVPAGAAACRAHHHHCRPGRSCSLCRCRRRRSNRQSYVACGRCSTLGEQSRGRCRGAMSRSPACLLLPRVGPPTPTRLCMHRALHDTTHFCFSSCQKTRPPLQRPQPI